MAKQDAKTTNDVAITKPSQHWIDAAKLAIHSETEIETLKGKVNETRSTVADAILQLGKESKSNLESFLNSCTATEAWAKSEQCPELDRWDTIPRCWTQAKSNVKAALKFDFKLSVFKSSYELRTALNEKRKQVTKEKVADKPTVDLGTDEAGNMLDGTIVNEYLQSIMATVKKLHTQAEVDEVATRLMQVEFYMLELLEEFDSLVGGEIVEGEEVEQQQVVNN